MLQGLLSRGLGPAKRFGTYIDPRKQTLWWALAVVSTWQLHLVSGGTSQLPKLLSVINGDKEEVEVKY